MHRFSPTSRFSPTREFWVDEDGDVTVQVVRIARRTLWQRFFAPRDEKITLDAMGSAIWKLCDAETTFAQMRDALAVRFPKEPQITERLTTFLQFLLAKQMLREIPPDTPVE